MDNNLPKEVLKISQIFNKAGYQIYIVGGAVRDLLMGREVNDWDFTTDAKPEEILKLFPNGFYNNNFGTVGVPNEEDKTVFEVTTMRKEGDYKDNRHPSEVGWTNKIEEDLARRDFTVNAMALAIDKNKPTIIDPFTGQQDLESKLIRAVGDPNNRFQEDALRLIRAIRFAAQLDFEIEEKTLTAIKQNSQLLENISYERIRDELFKLLSSDHPYEGVLLLRQTGIFQLILPELESCFGIVQEGPKHDRVYDIGEHSFLSLKYCPAKDPLVRFATLIHDVGKKDTMQVQEDGNVTFYGHDVVGSKIAYQIGHKFKLSKKEIDKLTQLVRWHLFTVDEHQTDSAIRRFIKNVGEENIDDMFALRVGDRLGGGTQKAVSWRMENYRERIDQVRLKPFSVTDLKINGKDIMEVLNLPPSPKVGEILDQLFQEVLEDDSKNNREYLLAALTRMS